MPDFIEHEGRSFTADVDVVFGVVPRPRSFDDPGAWPRGGRPKPRSWRTYYGYSRSALNGGSFTGHFSKEAVAKAMVDHAERCGSTLDMPLAETVIETPVAIVAALVECPGCRYPHEGEKCPNLGCDLNLSEAVKAERAERKRQDDEWTANFRRFYHAAPTPIEFQSAKANRESLAPAREEKPVVEIVDFVAPAAAAPVEAVDRYRVAVEVLREMAAAYGPRRAHKLAAMADFVEQHAKRAEGGNQ